MSGAQLRDAGAGLTARIAAFILVGIVGGASAIGAAQAADRLEPRPISATERAAVELVARYLAEGGEAWSDRLAPSSPWSRLAPDEAVREIEVRAGPPAGATWTLVTPAPGTPKSVALFYVVFPSGADDTVLLRLERDDQAPDGQTSDGTDEALGGRGWRIAELRSLSEPAPSHEETFFDPHDASLAPRPPTAPAGAPHVPIGLLVSLGALSALTALARFAAHRPLRPRLSVLALAVLALSCGAPGASGDDPTAGRTAEAPASDPAARNEGGASGQGSVTRLGMLRDIRWKLATDGDPSALGETIAQVAPEGLPHQVADLWRAQLLLRQVDLHEAEAILAGMPEPGPVPLADLLRARLATARGADEDASLAYDTVRTAGPDHDGLRLESAAALAALGFQRQSEVETIQLAEMGSRVAEVWYLRAQLDLLDDHAKEGEAVLRQAWTERPILRAELFGNPLLATLIARATLFPIIHAGSPDEPTVEAPDLGRHPARLPPDARASALGRLLRIEVGPPDEPALIEIPGGAALAPAGTRQADAAEWKRRDQEAALAHLDLLTDQARGMTAFGQPRLRRQILEAATALAEADRWDDLVVLTEGIENQIDRVPAVLGQLRALALRKTSRGADARSLLVRLAKASMDSRRPAPGVLYQLAELFVSDREFDTALRLLQKASALSPLASNNARIEQIRLEKWLYDNQDRFWSDHFEIIYPRMTSRSYAETLGVVLEAERERISRWVPLRPGHPIEVDLFPLERFLRAHSSGVLVLGLYDGRVRVPFADLQSLHPRLVSVLSHEVAHALLAQETYDRAPDWFQEGLAQHVEMVPGRVNPIPDLEATGRVISLPMIEAILEGFAEPQLVDLAYGESAWVIHYLEAVHGVKTIRAFAEAYSRGLSTEQVIREVLGQSVSELDHAVWTWCVDSAPSGWPTEIVRYDQELDGIVRRSDSAQRLMRQARGDDRAHRRSRSSQLTMASWYQTYNRDLAPFKASLRDILGPLHEGKIPNPIVCVTLSGQINQFLHDPQTLHPPDQALEQDLNAAFQAFAGMAASCSKGNALDAGAYLRRAERDLGAAARDMKRYGMRP